MVPRYQVTFAEAVNLLNAGRLRPKYEEKVLEAIKKRDEAIKNRKPGDSNKIEIELTEVELGKNEVRMEDGDDIEGSKLSEYDIAGQKVAALKAGDENAIIDAPTERVVPTEAEIKKDKGKR